MTRWATEDPNPTSKVAEKRRLEELGTEAIQAKLDPRMVDAVRAIRALEDGEEVPLAPEEFDDEEEEPEHEESEVVWVTEYEKKSSRVAEKFGEQ